MTTSFFYHIRQVAARVANSRVCVEFATTVAVEWEVIGGQRWYRSKERW